jgi:hypothetical protein
MIYTAFPDKILTFNSATVQGFLSRERQVLKRKGKEKLTRLTTI